MNGVAFRQHPADAAKVDHAIGKGIEERADTRRVFLEVAPIDYDRVLVVDTKLIAQRVESN